MAKLNLYTQQTRPQGARMSPQAAGAGTAQAMAQMGDVLGQIGGAIRQREDTISRVQSLNSFDQTALSDLEAIQADQSIASKQAVDNYVSALQQRKEQVLANYTGSNAGRAELRTQLDNQLGQYTRSAMGAQIKAQYQQIATEVDKQVNRLSTITTTAPDQVTNAMVDFQANLDNLRPAMTKDQYDNALQVGRGQIAAGAINGLLQRGNWQQAEQLLKDPNFGGMMDATTSRKLSMDVAVEGYKSEAAAEAKVQKVKEWTMTLRRDLTAEEKMRVEMLPDKKSEYTLADKITELELVQNRPATQAQIQDLMGMDSGGVFGSSLKGRALDFVTTNAPAYANGLLDPEQARQFQAAAAEISQPVMRQDYLGNWVPLPVQVPSSVTEALNRGNSFYGQSLTAMPQPAPAAAPAPAPTPALPAPTAAPAPTMAPAPAPTEGMPAPTTIQPSATPSIPTVQTDRTIWDRASNVAGVVPSVATSIGRTPGIGEMTGGGGQYAIDKQYVEAKGRDLIRALSQSGRYMATEMQAIEKEVNIAGQAFDTVAAYQNRLIGIDESLEQRAMEAQKDAANPKISANARAAAADVLAAITHFRESLGVPPRVKTVEEAMKLPAGSQFIDPNGIVRSVPGK